MQVVESISRDKLNSGKREEIVQYVKSVAGNLPVVTFKSMQGSSGINVIQGAYYSNLRGLDTLKGKDIVVLGTPHLPESSYRLYSAAFGLNDYSGGVLSYRPIEHNGYEVDLMSIETGSDLQKLQLWYLESEIIQAVGRARALRSERIARSSYSATCHFPRPQQFPSLVQTR